MIDLKAVEDALEFLAQTDNEAGQLKRAVELHDWLADKAESAAFLTLEGTVAERNHHASLDVEVSQQREQWLDCIAESASIENQRKTAQLKIGVWQSIQKARLG